ncbi:MAG: energy transducer TonB [Prevotella sp.]|nr:energy transducer TonB [Prevotella sp.]
MKKIFTFIAVCLMSLQFATAQEAFFEDNIQEQMPQFVGGEEALSNWIENNISFPMMADLYSIDERVVVSFDINEDGSVSNIQVQDSPNPIFADEVVNKLETMPLWIPAIQNGRYVKVNYNLAISFIF